MSKSRYLLALLFLGSIALAPVASWADAIHDQIPRRPRIPIHLHLDPASICDHVSGNLVKNCGFETGDFSDWTVKPAASGSHLIVTPHGVLENSGCCAAGFGASRTLDDSISQVLSTTPGQAFELSFFLRNILGTRRDAFSASWDGKRVFSAPTRAFPYTQFSFVVPGTGSDTLQFAGRNRLTLYLLDDIVVTPVPEPGTLSLFCLGLLLGGALLARRKKLLNGAQA